MILSSHILAEVREVCDYIMIISEGKLVASDTTENLENMMSGKGQIEVEAKASRDEILAFSHADVPMRTLNQSKTTLEEIFLELTQGSGNRMIKEEK